MLYSQSWTDHSSSLERGTQNLWTTCSGWPRPERQDQACNGRRDEWGLCLKNMPDWRRFEWKRQLVNIHYYKEHPLTVAPDSAGWHQRSSSSCTGLETRSVRESKHQKKAATQSTRKSPLDRWKNRHRFQRQRQQESHHC
jgi:hypothetical protein